jgi:hypothetical protein
MNMIKMYYMHRGSKQSPEAEEKEIGTWTSKRSETEKERVSQMEGPDILH